MGTDFVVNLILSILGSSAILALLNTYVFEPKRDRQKYIFDEKKHVYEAIIIFGQMVLYPEEARYSVGVARYSIIDFSKDEIIERGITELKMSIPKLTLISKNKDIMELTNKFIGFQDEATFDKLINILQKDLYK